MMYVVVRVGVYDQGVCAIEDNIGDASSAANYYAEQEHDLYHSFDVRVLGAGDYAGSKPVAGYDKVLFTLDAWDPETRKRGNERLWRSVEVVCDKSQLAEAEE